MAELLGAARLEPMIAAAVEYLEAQGFETLVVSSGISIDDEVLAWETLARSHCDGIIAHSDALSNDRLSKLVSTRKNVVLAHLDNKLAGQLAAKHLLHMGHRHIAMVAGPKKRYCVRELSEGFNQQIIKKKFGEIKFQLLEAPISKLGGARAMSELLNSDNCPTAVFCHSDVMAMGAMTTCQENAVRVPQDVSILGCGDLLEARNASTALSSIRRPLTAIGQSAAAKVIRLVNKGGEFPIATTTPDSLQPALVVRDSIYDRNKIELQDSLINNQISKRERECLQWASQGKTSWEISQILAVGGQRVDTCKDPSTAIFE
jgi:LacI family transcriptional regulator